MPRKPARWFAVLALMTLAACSGARGTGGAAGGAPITAAEASRFLAQASYGPTDSSISEVRASGYSQWIDQQMIAPQSTTHVEDLNARFEALRAANPAATLNPADFYWSFWEHAATDQDQLRERMKLALSEIFVISLTDTNVGTLGAGSYYDMLGANAFGNFRTLLENVTLSPNMGIYLSSLRNRKATFNTAGVQLTQADENFAREVMQLFTIGLNELQPDGTLKLDVNGQPIPNYTQETIVQMAKVFTGWGK